MLQSAQEIEMERLARMPQPNWISKQKNLGANPKFQWGMCRCRRGGRYQCSRRESARHLAAVLQRRGCASGGHSLSRIATTGESQTLRMSHEAGYDADATAMAPRRIESIRPRKGDG
jgi:hypothetical protein